MGHLNSLEVSGLDSKSWIANELLDALTCYDLPEEGLNKLVFHDLTSQCLPFEEEVISRVANMCHSISHLELSRMFNGSHNRTIRLSVANLFRQIVQQNPPLQILNMQEFCGGCDR